MKEGQHSSLENRAVYLIDGSRTPFLRAKSGPGPFTASDLAVQAGRPLLMRQPFMAENLDEVVLGCISSRPDEVNIARLVALRLGCGDRVPAWTVQRNCGSGMQALDSAALSIASGRSDLVLAGGVEAMSHYPLLLNWKMVTWLSAWNSARTLVSRTRLLTQIRPDHFQIIIALLKGLTDPVVGLSMGQTAEALAHRFDISREEMDAYALESHKRLLRARDSGWLEEVVPIYATNGKLYQHDEGLRKDGDTTKLSRLKPVFDRPVGKVTAGNSAQITDGAAWLILASEVAVEQYGLIVRGRLIDSHWSALDPGKMGLGPVYAMAALLKRQEKSTTDIDYWEINEAFAAQVLACLKAWRDEDFCRQELKLEKPFAAIALERLNVDGGGISIGHPVGASGARIVLHLLHLLERKSARRGIASLCIGGGQGGAMMIER